MSLRRLGQERLDLFQLHRIDPKVPAEEQFGLLNDLLKEGKVGAIGLSEVSVDEIKAARKIVPVVTVQNLYNLTNRKSEDVLDYCEQEGIGFIPWFPIAAGSLAKPGGVVDLVAKADHATPSQVSLAWLLKRSKVILPIPGTSSVAHVEENCAAGGVTLTDQQVQRSRCRRQGGIKEAGELGWCPHRQWFDAVDASQRLRDGLVAGIDGRHERRPIDRFQNFAEFVDAIAHPRAG